MNKYKGLVLYYSNMAGYALTVFIIALAAITIEWGLLVLGIAILLCNLIGWNDVRDLRKNPDWVYKDGVIRATSVDVLDSDGKEIK